MRKNFHIKRLYRYILKTFLPLFLMTFAICLFLVLMQFLWKYVEDMVGKGLGFDVLGEMFMYAALSLIPMALPLSILLASLMAFGNMGERLELLAIKSSGIPLLRTMSPLIVLIIFISIGAFFFQNDAMPKIKTKFYSLLISIRQKSPEVAIPEGVFYKDIDGLNIYVEKKNRETGMLYDVFIYDISNSFQDMPTIICDSAKMEMSEDKLSLVFTMFHGQQFRNFQQGARTSSSPEFIPYARENFDKKVMITSFDANFNRMGENVIEGNTSSNYVSKNLWQLKASIDSMEYEVDSVNVVDRKIMKERSYLTFRNSYPVEKKDSIITLGETAVILDPDSVFHSKDLRGQSGIMQSAYMKAENNSNEYLFRSMSKTSTNEAIRRHWIEWHRVFTLSFACLIFFFIGAPLGSIVRKGGLGMPIVISIVLFIIYYIFDTLGYKMARDGVWGHWLGMWFSSFVLLPLGIFLTYKAMNDSVILNTDTYTNFFKKVLFIREKRRYTLKEVIIDNPDYAEIVQTIDNLSDKVDAYLSSYKSLSFKNFWMNPQYDLRLHSIKVQVEQLAEQLSNSKNPVIVAKAEDYPIMINNVRPFKAGSTMAKTFMYVFPLGMAFKLISLPFEKRIHRDLRTIRQMNVELKEIIN